MGVLHVEVESLDGVAHVVPEGVVARHCGCEEGGFLDWEEAYSFDFREVVLEELAEHVRELGEGVPEALVIVLVGCLEELDQLEPELLALLDKGQLVEARDYSLEDLLHDLEVEVVGVEEEITVDNGDGKLAVLFDRVLESPEEVAKDIGWIE